MKLFKKGKPEEKPRNGVKELKRSTDISSELEDLPNLSNETENPKEAKFNFETPPRKEKTEFAPLFIKIDRYEAVLNLLKDLKSATNMVKNAISVQKEIEKLAKENRKMIENGVSDINDRLLSLDSEFVRPKGFEEGDAKPLVREKSDLDNVVDDLKNQVDDLKLELEGVS